MENKTQEEPIEDIEGFKESVKQAEEGNTKPISELKTSQSKQNGK